MLDPFPLRLPLILFFLTLPFGFWLLVLGKPYNGLLFNIHKLLALAGVVLAVMAINKEIRGGIALEAIIISLVIAAICVIASFLSGAMMSAGKLDFHLMQTLHRIAAGIMVVVIAWVIYFAFFG